MDCDKIMSLRTSAGLNKTMKSVPTLSPCKCQVTYTLQIAPSAGFTSITLEKQKLLLTGKETPYYWRVKAVDGASNESAWSDAWSFYISIFPGWAKYTLIGIGAVLFALLTLWIGMRIGRPAKLD